MHRYINHIHFHFNSFWINIAIELALSTVAVQMYSRKGISEFIVISIDYFIAINHIQNKNRYVESAFGVHVIGNRGEHSHYSLSRSVFYLLPLHIH